MEPDRDQENREAMGDKKDGDASLFLHQIVDFALALVSYICTEYSLYFSCTFKEVNRGKS